MSSTADASASASPSGPAPAPPGRPSALAPLRHPIFRAVWITSLVTNFGGLIQSVGAAWMMTSIASAQMVALVQASVTLPIMLLSLAAGALADTVDRRRIMLAAQTFMLLVSAGLAAMTWMGWITPWVLLTFTFLIGCGVAFNGPAWQASVGDMVPREDLAGAVTLNSMGFNMARSVGPALGGLIVAAAGAAAAFAVNAFSYIGLLIVLFRWKPERPKQTLPREGLLAAMAGGVRYAFLSPRVTAVLLRALVFGVGASAVQALMPVVARQSGGGPLVFGLLLGSFGVGAVGGALFVGQLRAKYETETIVRVAALAFAAAALGLAYAPWLAVTLPALMIAGAGWVLVLSSFNVTVQMSVPRWVVARALALYQMAAFGGMAGGSWLWGALAQAYGVQTALSVSAGVLALCILIGLKVPLPSTANLNMDLLRRWTEPQTALAIEPRSGPVIVSIAYRIREEDIDAFLALMDERRRIRRRDGARQWRLMRDLAEPQVWVEKYQTPTWLDYIRHNQRITHADASINEGIRALHQGPDRPVVHRMIERTTAPLAANLHGDRHYGEPLTDPTRSS
ncbi:MFS transporter [Brevundimonas diminuta]|uniref:MFS transporter n=1 Tax=Brevundimonas diminuta TaxID=293 RepID=UPI002097AD70|nr:MFS transporter [Brevundimonas diminuta]MCO8019566.1 MFS transporter [Brevundimonas diminuta]MCO8022648.1 MFS transporter [Brevundimonas diminuta]